jgi:hypothetical protein
MARILLWVADRGARLDQQIWSALCERLCWGLPSPAPDSRFEVAAGSFAALAIRTRAADPVPLAWQADGSLCVADSRLAPTTADLVEPSDRPAAIAVLDPSTGALRLLRDRLGQRPLTYARLRDGWLVASREAVLLAHPEVDGAFDDEFLAAHFAMVDPPRGRSCFRGVAVVEHGTRVDLEGASRRVTRLTYEPDEEVLRLGDVQAAARFRELLEASVLDCCAGAGRLGILLSAGLDSSSVAALLPADRRNPSTLAVNYGTTLDGGVDERPLAAELVDLLGLSLVSRDTADHPATLEPDADRDPAFPYVNPYRPLKRATYRAFAAEGCDVVLTGDFGDHWEAPARGWLVDAVRTRRWDVVREGLAWIVREGGLRALRRDAAIRHFLRRATGLPGRVPDFEWLRPEWRDPARQAIDEDRNRFARWPHPAHAAYNFGTLSALDAAYERHYSEPFGFDPRYPFRSWPFLRFALSLPGYQSWRAGAGKWVGRMAVAGVLPPKWSARPKLGDLLPLLNRLVDEPSRTARFRQLVESGQYIWERYVEPAAVECRLRALESTGRRDGLLILLAGLGAWLRVDRR